MATQSRKDVLEEKQCVILKGRRDGISILLDDKADFELIKDVLRQRVAGSRQFFEGAKATVTFKGRKLTQDEETALLDIIKHETDLRVAAIEEKEAPSSDGKLIPKWPQGLTFTESETYYYYGGLRSGQVIRQNGSVVVIGDVNPGAEIKATGNIIVLGALKGTAWAGAPGESGSGADDKCMVAALDFQPKQIRIGRVVIYMPDITTQLNHAAAGALICIRDNSVDVVPL